MIGNRQNISTFFPGCICLLLVSLLLGCTRSRGNTLANSVSLSSIVPHSVTLSVSDVERSASWYREKLGFEEVQRKNYEEFDTELVFLEKNGYRVELIQDGNATDGSPRPDPPGHTATFRISQFAFRTQDLEGVKAELGGRQVPITWEFENADLGAKFLFIRDPDKNLIQFLQLLEEESD